MSNENIAADIGRAWRLLREGKSEAAIGEFDRILKSDGNSVDGHYGMGLAQRNTGKHDAALKHFQKASELVESAIKIRNHTPGERNMPEDDRYMMLARMLQQRLAETESAGS
jgi:Tfp pilus assembly protein PilF